MKIRRIEQAGAVFSESLSSISDVRKRFTITGSLEIVDSPFGKAMSFDGSSYLTGIANNDFDVRDVSEKPFTICHWVYIPSAPANFHDCFTIGNTNFNALSWGVDTTRKIRFLSSTGGSSWNIDKSSDGTVTVNTWTHIAVTRTTAGVYTLYLNGVASGTVTNTTDIFLNNYIPRLAGHYAGVAGFHLNGRMKDFMFFKRALSSTEILNIAKGQPFDSEKNVVSEWDLSTINPRDVGWRGLGNNGTGTNMDSTNIVNGVGGGKALSFNGSDEYVTLPQNIIDINNTNWTLSAWVKRTGDFTGVDLIFGASGFDTGICGADSPQRIGFSGYTNGGSSKNELTTSNLNEWQHIVITWDGTYVYLYSNGEFIGNEAIGDFKDLTNWYIGAADGSRGAPVVVDKCMIFDKALTQLEVKDLHARQRGGTR